MNSSIVKSTLASARQAEHGLCNARDGAMLCNILEDLGHPQAATPIQTDNMCASGVANDTPVKQRLQSYLHVVLLDS
jgi:hypothetical protein